MPHTPPSQRLGLSVPYEWWPAAPMLKEIEAAGFSWVQVPAPPTSVLSSPRQAGQHARALTEAVDTSGLRLVIHAPGTLRAGTPEGDRAMEGLLAYAAETGAGFVVYHAARFLDVPASEDLLLAETRSLAVLANRAGGLGVTIAVENLAPVYPGPDLLSFSPRVLRTMVKRIGSPALGICLDIGHANLVASLRRADPLELIEPALDHTVLFHLHDNLGARRTPSLSPELDPVRLDLHLPPGRGSVPWERISPLLSRRSGPFLLEVHPPRPAPSAIFREAHAVLAPPPAVPAPA